MAQATKTRTPAKRPTKEAFDGVGIILGLCAGAVAWGKLQTIEAVKKECRAWLDMKPASERERGQKEFAQHVLTTIEVAEAMQRDDPVVKRKGRRDAASKRTK